MSAQAVADPIKEQVREHYDRLAAARDTWYRRGRFYHDHLEGTLRALTALEAHPSPATLVRTFAAALRP